MSKNSLLLPVAAFLFFVLFIIYSLGVSSSVYGGDSGDIILASWFGGVAHPPGYPLSIMIGWVFTHLPYQSSVAFKANLMAAFLIASVGSVLFLIIEKLTKNILIGVITTLIFALNPLIWLYAHVIEVFQLNLLLVALSVYFLLSWREQVGKIKKAEKKLILSILFLGLAVFQHQTSILLVPAFMYIVTSKNRKIFNDKGLLFKLLFSFCLGILPFIFIPFAAFRKTPINWDDPVNVHNFLQLITRADYGSFTASSNLVGETLKPRINQVKEFFLFLRSDFTILGLLLILIGAISGYFRERKLFYFLLAAVFFTGPFFLFYASFPLINDFFVGLWERFVLLAYFFLAIFLGLGINFIFMYIEKISQHKNVKKLLGKSARSLLVIGVFALLPLYLFFVNLPKSDLKNFKLGDWLGHDVLASAEPGAILFTFSDTVTFNSQYVYYTSRNSDNLKLILPGQLRHSAYRVQVMSDYPELKFPDNFLDPSQADSTQYFLGLLDANLNHSPIYSTGYYPPVEGYEWMKVGLLKKLVKKDLYNRESLVSLNESTFKEFDYKDFGQNVGYGNFMNDDIKYSYFNSLIELADNLIVLDSGDQARKYLASASRLFPEDEEPYIRLGNLSMLVNDCKEAINNFEKAFYFDKKNWQLADVLAGAYGKCLNDETKSEEFKNISHDLKEKTNSLDKL